MMPHTLTKPQFEILSALLASIDGEPISLDTAAARELEQLGCLSHGRPTAAGREAFAAEMARLRELVRNGEKMEDET